MENFLPHKVKCFSIFIFLSIQCIAQPDSDDEYQIASLIIDSLATRIDFDYYHSDAPLNASLEEYRLFPDSVFTRIDPDTYEDVVKTGREWDSILTSQFQIEQQRFSLRKDDKSAVMLIGTFRNIYHYHDINLYSHHIDVIRESGIEISWLSSYEWECNRLATNHDLTFQEFHLSNLDYYKYVIKAMVHLSNVIYNPDKDHALIQVGYHHKIHNGSTGGGMLILLARQHEGWKIIKTMGLWEE